MTGAELREYRERIGIRQNIIARVLHVSRTAVCRYEAGRPALGEDKARRAMEWLHQVERRREG